MKLFRVVAALCVCWHSASWAQAVTIVVADARDMSDAPVRRVMKGAEAALKKVSALAHADMATWRKGAPRKACKDDACLRDLARNVGTTGALVLVLKGAETQVLFDVAFFWDGERLGQRHGEGELDTIDASLQPAIEAILPPWARRGWGGLKLDVPANAVVKIDGRTTAFKSGEVMSIPSGAHTIDVVLSDGRAVLQTVTVAEGAPQRVDTSVPEGALFAASNDRFTALRALSYGAFAAGSLTVGGAFIAGTASRFAMAQANTCAGDLRVCPTYSQAEAFHRNASSLANVGNVLLGVGVGLVVVGSGLFAADVVGASP